MKLAAALAAYIGSILAANYLTSSLGLVPIGFGLAVTAGTFAAGAALILRDWVQTAGGRWWVAAAIEPHRDRCLFVAVPDVVGDGPATLARFPAMAARIRARGWPVALVGQDGMENLDVPWDAVDWIFVGGSTEWKLGRGAIDLIRQAQAHGKRVHVGRVNSGQRFGRFASLGCDTADGTFLAFGPEVNAPKVRGWMRAAAHPTLWRAIA